MKAWTYTLIVSLFLLCFQDAHSQSRKKRDEEKYVFVSTSLSYYPQIDSYDFTRDIQQNGDNIILTFLTSTSGTFEIEDEIVRNIDQIEITDLTSNYINFGISLQFRNEKSVFHEIGISRLSHIRSSFDEGFVLMDNGEVRRIFGNGASQKSTVGGIKYELGKYFGNKKINTFRFGMAGIVEQTLYKYNRTPFWQSAFPIEVLIYSIDFGISPLLSFRISDKVFFDLKPTINFRTVDLGFYSINDPNIPLSNSRLKREINFGEIDFIGTMQLRIVLKEPEKRRRRRR